MAITLSGQVSALAAQIGTDVIETTNQSSVVAAINDVKVTADGASTAASDAKSTATAAQSTATAAKTAADNLTTAVGETTTDFVTIYTTARDGSA